MNWSDILHEIQKGESSTRHFLKSNPNPAVLGPLLCALANTQKASMLLIGFDPVCCHFTGLYEHDVDTIKTFIKQAFFPPISIKMDSVYRADRCILCLHITPENPPLIRFKNDRYLFDANTSLPVIDQNEPQQDLLIFKPLIPDSQELQTQEPSTLNDRQSKTLEYLTSHFSISNKTYRGLYGISHKTAHIELVDMVLKGYLQPEGSGRSTCYIVKK